MATQNYNPPSPGPLNQTAQPAGVPHWVRPRRPTVKNILGCSPDHGDHQCAWKILNLHSKNANEPARRPDPTQFRDWCNEILHHIWDGNPAIGSVDHRRAVVANRMVLSAMHSIAGIRRPGHDDWKPNRRVRISQDRNHAVNGFECDDFPEGLNGLTWNIRVYVPATFDDFENHYGQARHKPTERDEPWMRRKWAPTPHMQQDARRQRDEDARANIACYGFQAQPHFMFPDDKTDKQRDMLRSTFFATPVPQNEDSLWQSLSFLMRSNLHDSKHTKNLVARWFDEVLTGDRANWMAHPPHRHRRWRFRMYPQLLASSVQSSDNDDVRRWGSLDLMRCLHRNARESGKPMEAGFHEMLHLVADYFNCEVITFTPAPDAPPLDSNESLTEYLNDNPFEMRVYGKPYNPIQGRLPQIENQQILLATDAQLRYFQPVFMAPETPRTPDQQDERQGAYIDTRAFDPWDRHSPMPWWPGFRRRAGLRRGWTGDWNDRRRRRNFTPAQMNRFALHDIATHLFDAGNNPVIGPYWKYEGLLPGPEGAFWLGDADSDRCCMALQDEAMRASWRAEEPGWAGPEDAALRVEATWAAAAGAIRDVRYRSDKHRKGVKRTADCYLEQYPDHVSVERTGFLRVLATDVEDRTAIWHKRKRKNR